MNCYPFQVLGNLLVHYFRFFLHKIMHFLSLINSPHTTAEFIRDLSDQSLEGQSLHQEICTFLILPVRERGRISEQCCLSTSFKQT